MKNFLRDLSDIALFACGSIMTVLGCFGMFVVDPDDANFIKIQLYAIQGLAMVICARV